jgi:hypothetical protein
MPENEAQSSKNQPRTPWNKGKLIGAKPPLRPKHEWSIRTRLMVEGRTRDLALFNLAIDSKLRGCDVVALKVEDVARQAGRTSRHRRAWSGGCPSPTRRPTSWCEGGSRRNKRYARDSAPELARTNSQSRVHLLPLLSS